MSMHKLTRNILVTTKGRRNHLLIGELDTVLLGRREQSLQHRQRRVEDNAALASVLDTNMNLFEVC